MENTLRREQVEPRLRGRFGRPYEWRDVCESTQELARALPSGGVAACEQQTAGRGRRGRTWASPHGLGVLFSVSLRPATPPDRLAPFSLVAAEAVCEALDERAEVRWPNDVVVNGRKLAGVLAEVRDGQMVVGIGVNANLTADDLPSEARVPATSLLLETGAEANRAQLIADILWSLETRYDDFEHNGFRGLGRDELRGRSVRLAGGREGICDGTDGEGRLVVDGVAHTSAEVAEVSVGG
jgi:BirA family biotin operon repressor/biotin-[acetyl-CoA-carboxylase] ligase